MLSKSATPETQGEVQGITSMAMGLGTLIAPLLLTGVMAHFTGPNAPFYFPGAAFIVSAVFTMLCVALVRRLPQVSASTASDIATP
jgi:MFS transporter, DHA1 family, tetracycline resistance protein